MNIKNLDNLDLKGKKVLLRCDLNVPFDLDGKVLDSTKIERHKITIKELMHKGAKIIIISHIGRPNGKINKKLSMLPVSKYLSKKLDSRFSASANADIILAASFSISR